MTRVVAFLASILAVIAFAGCSSSDDSDPYATVEMFCEAWAARACTDAVVKQCSGMDDKTDERTEACRTSQRDFCEKLVPRKGYGSGRAQECLDAVGAAYDDGKLTAKEIATVRHRGEACRHLLQGSQAEDESCESDDECDTVRDYVCILKSGAGHCEIPMVVENGNSCAAPEAACNPGYYCGGDRGDENCVKSKAAGGKCSESYQCNSGLDCLTSGDDEGGSGTCGARVSQSKCTVDADCTTNVCDVAAGADTGTCVNSVVLTPTDSLCEDLR